MILITKENNEIIRTNVSDIAEALIWICQYIYIHNNNTRYDCPFVHTELEKCKQRIVIDVDWDEIFCLTSPKDEKEIVDIYVDWNGEDI